MIGGMFVLVSGCAILSTAVARLVRARYPGIRTLCHWMLLATWGVGFLFGCTAMLLGAGGTTHIATLILLAASMVVLTQIFGWLLLLDWLRDVEVQPLACERTLLAGLSQLELVMARVAEN